LTHRFQTSNKHKVLQILSQLIYSPKINTILRGILKSIPKLPKKLRLNPSGVLPVSLKNGSKMELLTNQTCYVTTFVYWEGSSAYEFTDIFQDLFPKIKCFLDVGSNIGYYTLMAGKCNPSLEIHAFDPSPGPFSYLQENISLNHISKAKAHQLALSDEDGRFSFHIAWNREYPWLKYNSLGGSGHLSHVRENPTLHTVEVEALRLDSFVRREGLKSIDLIKLDVEEAEHLVLAGGAESIRKFRPIIVCEVFSTEMLHKIREQILSQEYLAFRFDESDRKLHKENLTENSSVKQIENFFFVPEEKTGLLSNHFS